MKIILKGSHDIYLNGDFFQNKWKSTEMQEKPKNSKKIQEDENRSPREPNNTLQVVILQENSMDESLDFELYATNLKSLEDGHQNEFWTYQ